MSNGEDDEARDAALRLVKDHTLDPMIVAKQLLDNPWFARMPKYREGLDDLFADAETARSQGTPDKAIEQKIFVHLRRLAKLLAFG